MSKMIRVFFATLIFALFPCVFHDVLAQPLPQMTCPVMPGEKVKGKFYANYHGQRIYLCCRNCVKAFKRHPERYRDRLPHHDARTFEEKSA